MTKRVAKRADDIPVSKALKRIAEWKVASTSEVQGLMDNGTVLIKNRSEILPGSTIVTTRWVVTDKRKNDGTQFMKCRLVARGFQQDVSSMTESVTANRETVRILAWLAS